MKIELVSTGVEAVDTLLGGIARDQVTLVRGGPGSGKTCFALSYAAAAIGRGEPTCIITTDEPESIIAFADKYLHFDVHASLRAKLLTVLSFARSFESKVRSMGDIGRPCLELRELFKTRSITSAVFDTFDPVLAATSVGKAKTYINGVIGAVMRLGATCVCTSLASGSDALRLGSQEMASRLPATFDLDSDSGGRVVRIHEASWSGLKGSAVPIDFVVGRGIVVTGQPIVADGGPASAARVDRTRGAGREPRRAGREQRAPARRDPVAAPAQHLREVETIHLGDGDPPLPAVSAPGQEELDAAPTRIVAPDDQETRPLPAARKKGVAAPPQAAPTELVSPARDGSAPPQPAPTRLVDHGPAADTAPQAAPPAADELESASGEIQSPIARGGDRATASRLSEVLDAARSQLGVGGVGVDEGDPDGQGR